MKTHLIEVTHACVQVDCHSRLFDDEHFTDGSVCTILSYVLGTYSVRLIRPPFIFASIATTINARHAGKQLPSPL